MKNPAFGIFLVVVLGLMLAASGCGTPGANLGQPGKSIVYVAGTPSFDLEAQNGNDPQTIEIFISIPYASLMFLRESETFSAIIEVSAEAYVAGTDSVVGDGVWTETVNASTYEETTRAAATVLQENLRVRPGSDRIEVSIVDKATGRKERRTQLLDIPDPLSPHPMLGRIELEKHNDHGGWETVVPFHVQAGLSGLRCRENLYGLSGGDTARVNLSLLHYPRAQSPARTPDNSYLTSSSDELPPQSFGTPEVVIARHDSLVGGMSPSTVILDFGYLPPGLYVLNSQADVRGESESRSSRLNTKRVLSIKSPTFPRPATLKELVEGMTYLLRDEEHKAFAEAGNPERTKAIFDSLWLKFGQSPEAASSLIRLYYSRVEEANMRFSEFKEGWKTDRGMVYIVFGPPESVQNSMNEQSWYYGVSGSPSEVQFVFQTAVVGGGDLSIRTYVLHRSLSYAAAWRSMVDQWRRGRVF
jgi:GWxTD domain-containing protein